MGAFDISVFYPDGSGELVLSPPPDPTWIDTVLGENFDGRTIVGGESAVIWQWGNRIDDGRALAQSALDLILARIDGTNKIRIRTINTAGQYVICDARTDLVPSHTKADGYVLGLRMDFRRVVPV